MPEREAPNTAGGVDLSVVIPTLDEAVALGDTLAALARLGGRVEVVVADGGSRDATVEIAVAHGATVVVSPERGRGAQLAAGARAVRGEVLWFLHADTLAPGDALEAIRDVLADGHVAGGNFHIRFDGGGWAARFLTWLYPRLRLLGLYYGDSGIFARREAYERAGGFLPHPLFEDLDLVRRLRRVGRMRTASSAVITSSRRFEGRSFALTFARWAALQALYWIGVPPDRLARAYAPLRAPGGLREQSRRITAGPRA
jgi:rSAM/selenodomain-associated transferase 2